MYKLVGRGVGRGRDLPHSDERCGCRHGVFCHRCVGTSAWWHCRPQRRSATQTTSSITTDQTAERPDTQTPVQASARTCPTRHAQDWTVVSLKVDAKRPTSQSSNIPSSDSLSLYTWSWKTASVQNAYVIDVAFRVSFIPSFFYLVPLSGFLNNEDIYCLVGFISYSFFYRC